MRKVIEVRNLYKLYRVGDEFVRALDGVDFEIYEGEFCAIVGTSGSGKSTLLNMLAGLEKPTKGEVIIAGRHIEKLNEEQLVTFRRNHVGFIFQSFHLMGTLNAVENVALPLSFRGVPRDVRVRKANEMLDLVKLGKHKKHLPNQMSGGQQQRVGVARALVVDPDIIFADEPTTALDVTIQAQILDLLREIQMKLGTATILVSHDLGVVARVADRVAVMYAGKIVEIGTAEEVYYDPRHPYTWGLMRSLPAFANGKESLYTIPGMPPTLIDPPKGDAFACRNEYALNIDYEEMPPMFKITDTHYAATWLLDPRAPQIKSPMGGIVHE